MWNKDITGSLDKRVTFKDINQVADEAGGFTESLSAGTTVWGDVVPINSRKLFENGILLNQNQYEVKVRKDAITPTIKMQIEFSGLTLKIDGVQNVREDGFFWRILASEVHNG